MRASYLFTSESVSEGHPDKVCDRISDEIVDLFYREAAKAGMDPSKVRVACETLATTNRVVIAGETRGPASVTTGKVKSAARRAIKAIGYEQDEVKIFMPANAAEPVYAPFRAKMEPAYKRIADYAGADNVKKFRDIVEKYHKG